MKYINIVTCSLLACYAMTFSTAGAENIRKKTKNAAGIEVTYQSSYKGKVMPGELLMKVVGNEVSLKQVRPEKEKPQEVRKQDKAPIVDNYIDYQACKSYRRAELPDGKIISSATPFEFGKGFKEVGTEQIMGLNCKILQTSINSNTIQIWYTTDIPFRGTPQANVGVPDGLVLKVVRNGDMVQEATAIRPEKKADAPLFPESWGETMDVSDFQYTINQSVVISIPVFSEQRICFNGAKLPEEMNDQECYSAAGGTIILKKVKLPDYVANRTVFVEVAQYSDGDAYDRTGSIFLIPTDKKQSFLDALRDLNSVPAFRSGETDYHGLVSTDNYNVPMELMRFFHRFRCQKL